MSSLKICNYCHSVIDHNEIQCPHCYAMLSPMRVYTRWHRIYQGSKIAGVCQGIAQYFNLPVVLVRLAFIIATLIGGWGVLIYGILCLLPAQKTAVAATTTPLQKSVPPIEKKTSRPLRPIQKLLRFVFFLGCLVCVYLPFSLFLIFAILIFLWGLYYPIFSFDIFTICLSDLGVPGVLWGIFVALSLILLLYFLIHWVMQFHFSQYHNGKFGKWWISFVIFATIACSSLFIISLQHHNSLSKTWEYEITPRQNYLFAPIDSTVPIRRISLSTTQDTPRILYHIKAYGLTYAKIFENLDAIQVVTDSENILAQFQIPQQNTLNELSIEIMLPENSNVTWTANSIPVNISGLWENVYINTDNMNCRVQKSQIKALHVQSTQGKIWLKDVVIDKLQIQSEQGKIESFLLQSQDIVCQTEGVAEWRECSSDLWHLDSEYGQIHLQKNFGTFKINNRYGYTAIENFSCPDHSNSYITTETGNIYVAFGNEIPDLKITGTKVQGWQNTPNSNSVWYIDTKKGRLKIEYEKFLQRD